MIFPANSIARKLLVTMSLVVAGLVLVLGGLEIVQEYGRYRHEVDALWGQQVEARKKQLEMQVSDVVSYIEFKKSQVRAKVQGSLEARVRDAHGVASHLYEISKDSHSPKELRRLVREALRKQRFNNGRGYFFIFAMDGTVLLHAAQPELEQKNLLALQDTQGAFVIREMIELARSKGEGFVPYLWPKPGFPPDQEFEKISFIKYLPQLDCFIGAGEYLDDTEAEVKAEVLERIEKSRFGGGEYIFAGQWDGVSLAYPTKGRNMLGVTDANGVKVVAEAIALARKEGGFLLYVMPKVGEERNSLKLSYVRGVKDWQWYVGSGVYLDDLEAASAGARRELRREIAIIVGLSLLVMLAIFLAGLFVVRKTAGQIQHAFAAFEIFFDKAAREKVEMQTSGLHFEEFRSLAKAANQMLVERRAMEEGLRKSEEKYRVLIDTTGTGFVKIDGEGRVLDANQEYVRMTGHGDLAEILGRRVTEWTAEHDLAKNREAVQECARLGFIRHLQIDYVDGQGELTPMELNATVVQGEGQPEILTICHDVSLRKQMEEQLRQAQKMEAIGTLAGGIAHDFNNILAAILGYAEMAARSLPPEAGSAKADIQQVLRAGLRARDLVKQILTFSRKSGEERAPISPRPIVKEALKFLRASIPASVEIREDIASDCGAILADATNIHQIVVNLCTNAFHAMEAAGGVLTVIMKNVELDAGELAGEGDLQPGAYVLFSVGDTGPGMTPEVLSRIFDPYFTTKSVGKGSGMGLAVVHGIVKNYGGMVQVDSTMGSGTVFRVYLPRIGSGADAPESVQEWALPSGGQERILFVDDETSIAEMGKAMLSGLGYRVTARTNPLEALEEFRRQPGDFDLLITDQTMPKLSGLQLVQEVHDIRPGLPVILCTGYSAAIEEESAAAQGINYFLMKPLTMRMLTETVRKALGQ
ncbi:cache domain-containing protein [Thiovibrio frasassiensis]|uniref:histidine kinase n=1 Tax=Thiovibrio frasassiensis TaxID=2984131 RepID=A0A9X4RLJ6_9BACT|nr:cache domain-containing protein [Thiovibrio frasassiensis]MDG4475794.1 cache domain-containing protein [Thiovibrio frasassiensis]